MDTTTNTGNAALRAYAATLHPHAELSPCDLQPGGRYALPPGFEIHIDPAHDEHVRVFGPHETGTRLNTLTPYGGRFVVRGLDVLRALATLMRVGEPVWEKALDARATYLRALLDTAAPFEIPAWVPSGRAEMESHINTCAQCGPVAAAYGEAVDSGASITDDTYLKAMIDRAHANPAAAAAYYLAIRDGRMNLGAAPVKQTRTKRATHPVAVTQEA